MITGIYKIQRIDTDECYVGQAINIEKRWREHAGALRRNNHHCQHLQRAWNKYGEDCFIFSILETVDGSRAALQICEQKWMDKIATYNHFPSAGSPLGFKHSEKTKQKMRGRIRTPEHCMAISLAKRGNVIHTPEARKKMSETRIALGIKPPSQKGRKQSPEHRAKIAAAMIGNKNTLGYRHTTESIEKIRKAHAKT